MHKANEQAEGMKARILREAGKVESGELSATDLVGFIQELDAPKLVKLDFAKQARVKTQIAPELRCVAMRADNDQCTRRKKAGSEYCGTHTKGVPHGVLGASKMRKTDVWAENVDGIIYYLDETGAVYKTEEVMNKKVNPLVIGHWHREGEKYVVTTTI